MADALSWRQRLLRGTGYLALVLATYLVALWQLLPYEEIGYRVEAALRAQGIGAEVRALGPGGVLGCVADTLNLYPVDQPDLLWRGPLFFLCCGWFFQRLIGLFRRRPQE